MRQLRCSQFKEKRLCRESSGSFGMKVILRNFCQDTNAETKVSSDPMGLAATPALEFYSTPTEKGEVLYFIVKLMRNLYPIPF